MKSKKYLLYATRAYAYLAEKILAVADHYQAGNVEHKQFPDGEHYLRIIDDVKGKNVALLGGTISDADTLELYDLAFGLVRQGALSLTLVIPYFGYSTMERAVHAGEVVVAKSRAVLFSSLPTAPLGSRILLFDLHSEGIPHYFDSQIHTAHIYCKPLVYQAVHELSGGQEYVLASTDAGRAKWVESLANDLRAEAAYIIKKRISGDSTAVLSVNANVQGKPVIIYDDMIRTGGSLLKAAETYLSKGATQVSVITTHGIFVNNALERLQSSGLIHAVYCSDSYPRAQALQNGFLKVISMAGLIAEHL